MTGVIQPLNGMNSRTLSNRYKRSSDNKDAMKSPDSEYENSSAQAKGSQLRISDLLVNPKISDTRRGQKTRKVVINIINGGDETKRNETLENVVELTGRRIQEKLEDGT